MEPREPIELPVERIPNSDGAPTFRAFEFRFGNFPPPFEPPRPRRRRPRVVLPVLLFFATWLSTFLVGGVMFSEPIMVGDEAVLDWNSFVSAGLKYSTALMGILLAHEMGHFLQARRYRVPASLPWFIPIPSPPMGTMGAVIVQAAGFADRKQLFDIGISGPLAGLVLALPITVIGLQDSRVMDLAAEGGGMTFGNPLLLQWLAEWRFGPLGPNEDILLTPLLHAGWVGIFVTALNLFPIGQLDGGHVLYCLIGRRAHVVARLLLLFAIGSMFVTGNWSYSFMVLLLVMMGPRHPPSRDDSVPLGRFREVLGWVTLSFVLIGFTPTPVILNEPAPRREPERHPPAEEIFVEDRGAEHLPNVDLPVRTASESQRLSRKSALVPAKISRFHRFDPQLDCHHKQS